MNTDKRGVRRGGCTVCTGCSGYDGGLEGKRCIHCSHPPAKHVNMDASPSRPSLTPALQVTPNPSSSGYNVTGSFAGQIVGSSVLGPECLYVGCHQERYFDMNTTELFWFCEDHIALSTGQGVVDQTDDSYSQPPQFYGSEVDSLIHPSMSLPAFSPSASLVTIPPDQQCKLDGCTKQRHTDPTTGKVHDCCGRRHALSYGQKNGEFFRITSACDGAVNVPPELQCKTPHCTKQRRRTDQGTYFDFCGIYCRDHGSGTPTHSDSTPNMALSADGQCSLVGCSKPKYRDVSNGRLHDFCGRTHANLGQSQGIVMDDIKVRTANPQELKDVTKIFGANWARKKGQCPPIVSVLVISNRKLTERWNTYKSNLQNKSVERHYHGTKLTCNITAHSSTAVSLCNDKDCGVCGISRFGFDRRCIQKNITFQRFGHGFYVAPNSSKCHDYTQGKHGVRALILFDVLAGNKYCIKKQDPNIKSPPQGYDSVYGQAGGCLNYEELVIYNPDAALPKFIIVYQKDGGGKIATG